MRHPVGFMTKVGLVTGCFGIFVVAAIAWVTIFAPGHTYGPASSPGANGSVCPFRLLGDLTCPSASPGAGGSAPTPPIAPPATPTGGKSSGAPVATPAATRAQNSPPPGFPTNLPGGNYDISACIQVGGGAWGNCNSGGVFPLATLAQNLDGYLSCSAQANTTCTNVYTAFDGHMFTVLQTQTTCDPGSPCSTGEVLFRITKV